LIGLPLTKKRKITKKKQNKMRGGERDKLQKEDRYTQLEEERDILKQDMRDR